jgi:hypothetical protein
MGHHAQYRKRFGSSVGSINALPAPSDTDWLAVSNPPNVQASFIVDPPAGASKMANRYMIHGGEWQFGGVRIIKNAFGNVLASAPPGTYFVQAAWTNSVGQSPLLSDWSNAKQVTVT